MLKQALRGLCPPVLWEAAKGIKRRLPGGGEQPPPYRLGRNSLLVGSAERRAHGAGGIVIGDDCYIWGRLVAATGMATIRIGNNVFINNATLLDCAGTITVEDDVQIGYLCLVADHDAAGPQTSEPRPVCIRRGAWIGARCLILQGVTIGIGSIVGAGSVVTRDVPDWSICAGNPSRIVRTLGDDER
jgi:acetyltransferase-like isoleucine patch superfamily enzyme